MRKPLKITFLSTYPLNLAKNHQGKEILEHPLASVNALTRVNGEKSKKVIFSIITLSHPYVFAETPSRTCICGDVRGLIH